MSQASHLAGVSRCSWSRLPTVPAGMISRSTRRSCIETIRPRWSTTIRRAWFCSTKPHASGSAGHRRCGDGGGSAQRGHAAFGERCGVGHDHLVSRAGQRPQRIVDDPGQRLRHRRVVALRFGMHPGDRGAGQDVVELLEQHRLPGSPQLGVRVRGPGPHRRGCCPQLGLPQQVLTAPVALLGPGLGGVGAPVELQVQLARPDRRAGQSRPRRRRRTRAGWTG